MNIHELIYIHHDYLDQITLSSFKVLYPSSRSIRAPSANGKRKPLPVVTDGQMGLDPEYPVPA